MLKKIRDWIRQWFKREKPVVIPQQEPTTPACGCSMKWIKGKKIPGEGELQIIHGTDCRALGIGSDKVDFFVTNTVFDNGFCAFEKTPNGMIFHAKCFTHPKTGDRFHYYAYNQPSSEGPRLETNNIEVPCKDTFRVWYRVCEG